MIEHFANPGWSTLIWIVLVVVVVLFFLDQRGSSLLDRFVSATMGKRLVHRMPKVRRWLSIILLGGSGICLVIALMRPQWGLSYIERQRAGAQIMVCLDVSRSMLAEDVVPNRLERAKAEINDLLTFMDGDQVGLIAFAGRATVLCPMTSDFSFFKMILDEAGPHSVGRGGTRLEEPIRRAVDGFRMSGDASRAVLLITDGEDHDSHPVDAAKSAAERGIKILAIGFGDEAGSEIEYTDPRSGVRSKVLDENNRPVITRLDGETLRTMAMETDGAYIPAGTGMLDLKSIHDAHIAPLMRGQVDDRGQAVRNDSFQWAILLGMLLFLASIVAGSGNVQAEVLSPTPWTNSPVVKAAMITILLLMVPDSIGAQTISETSSGETESEADIDSTTDQQAANSESAEGDGEKNDEEEADPRELFNDALAFLDSNTDKAERLLTKVRRTAGTDGEARFRATYNLGWVEINRANALLEETPKEALEHLRRSANWFRDAIRLRPEHDAARRNLEIVMRRILELNDSLANKDAGDLTKRLEAVITKQREIVSQCRALVERLDGIDDPNAADRLRADFRRLAIDQRTNTSDSQAVSAIARDEIAAINGKNEEEQTPENQMRRSQLQNLLFYTNRADQRLGQARSQMRRREANRAFRRAATGLSELKRARDQLREPVELLNIIVGEAIPLTELTSAKSAVDSKTFGGEDGKPLEVNLPAWVTSEYLVDEQNSLSERLTELVARLKSGLEANENLPNEDDAPQANGENTDESNAEAEKTIRQLKDAMPLLQEGDEQFVAAIEDLQSSNFTAASNHQVDGILALRAALERFMQLKQLINSAYETETQIKSLLAPPDSEASIDSWKPPIEAAREMQTRNLQRASRLASMINEEMAAAESQAEATATDTAGGDDAEASQASNSKRYQLAKQFLELAKIEMESAVKLLNPAKEESTEEGQPNDEFPDGESPGDESPNNESSDDEPYLAEPTASDHVDQSIEYLESLRRLFFTLAEHLRETAEQQANLNDKTETLAADATTSQQKQLGPISREQLNIQKRTFDVAEALQAQSESSPQGQAAPGQQLDPSQQKQLDQMSQQYAEAAKLVFEGADAMRLAQEQSKSAADALNPESTMDVSVDDGVKKPADEADNDKTDDEKLDDKVKLESIRDSQDDALRKLVEALQLLQPPQNQDQNQKQDQQDQQQQNEQQPEPDEQQSESQPSSQLLQSILDREARRRKDKNERRQQEASSAPVAKDW